MLDDDGILGHIDQPASQVARVGRLERGIRQALAGAVRGVEVLENREPFLEVRDDRRLDDFAGWFRHQAAHAGQLFDLGRGTAGTRMRHHVDRVHVPAAALRDDIHHLLGDPIRAM